MNGKSHYVVGAAVASVTTYALIQLHELISQHAPDVVAKVFSPPATLLRAEYVGQAVNNLHSAIVAGNGDGASANAMSNAMSNPAELVKLGSGLVEATTGTATTVATVLLNWLIILAVGMVSGLFPDIDHGGSTISQGGRNLGRLIHTRGIFGLLLKILFALINLLTQTLSFLAGFLGGHRGPVHTATAMLVVSLTVGVAANGVWSLPFYGFIFGCGYLSHLIIDSPNPTGIMWLWPFSRKYFHLGLPERLWFHSSSPLANFLIQLVSELIFGLTAYSVVQSQVVGVDAVTTALASTGNETLSNQVTLGVVGVIVLALVVSSVHSYFQGVQRERWQEHSPQHSYSGGGGGRY